MPLPIIEDFAAIHARMLALRARQPETPVAPPAGPPDFYGWLMSGNLWLPGT